MDVCLLRLLCVVTQGSLCRADHSSRGVLPNVLCLIKCHFDDSTMRRPWPISDCCAMENLLGEKSGRDPIIQKQTCRHLQIYFQTTSLIGQNVSNVWLFSFIYLCLRLVKLLFQNLKYVACSG